MITSQRLIDSSTGHTGHWTADKLSLVPDLAAETPGQWSRVTCDVSRVTWPRYSSPVAGPCHDCQLSSNAALSAVHYTDTEEGRYLFPGI